MDTTIPGIVGSKPGSSGFVPESAARVARNTAARREGPCILSRSFIENPWSSMHALRAIAADSKADVRFQRERS